MIKLFVVGFPKELNEMQFAELFGPFGNIKELSIARDKVSGKSKAYGFIEMDDAGAMLAMESLHGHAMGDRKLEVRIAVDKPMPLEKTSLMTKKDFRPTAGKAAPLRKRPRLAKK